MPANKFQEKRSPKQKVFILNSSGVENERIAQTFVMKENPRLSKVVVLRETFCKYGLTKRAVFVNSSAFFKRSFVSQENFVSVEV